MCGLSLASRSQSLIVIRPTGYLVPPKSALRPSQRCGASTKGGPVKLNHDFHELLECFARHNVRYLVIGGWALAAHGIPRLTKDLDLWVMPDSSNAQAVLTALEEFGFQGIGLTAHDFQQPEMVIQLGYPPNRVDLITSPSGVEFEQCWTNRLELKLDGVDVPFIGREELIANKRATGRSQDMVDIESLEERS